MSQFQTGNPGQTKREVKKMKKIKLHDYLNTMSPDAEIKLYDDEGNVLFAGYAGEITESTRFTNRFVDDHAYDGKDMLIWTY